MKRALAFLILCLGARLSIALIAKNLSTKALKLSAIPALILGLAFVSLYLFDLRKNGIEAGGKIWWNSYRPIHGMLFILYSIYAFKGENAYIVLLLDVFIGLFVWIHKYYLTKEFLHVDS
tara:strand:+ start:300 stop:659 length:360 start_codon:yes stop_codon:yes gene_type:complete